MTVRERGLSFRQAHRVVARVVRTALAQGLAPTHLTGALVKEAAMEAVGIELKLDDAAVRDALDPQRFVETRITLGSVGPPQVARLLEHAKSERDADRLWISEARARLARAREKVDHAVNRIVAAEQAA